MNVKIGSKIRELRKRDDITQERLAEAIGVTNQAISKWESETGYPDIEYIAPIADFFNVSIDYLFNHETGDKTKKIEEYRDIVKKIHNIQDASHHLMNLINDVLDMPKTDDAAHATQTGGYLISNMGEMKAPVRAIRDLASVYTETADSEKKDDAIKKIRDASNHLLGVLNDIIDIWEIKANKMTLSSSKFYPGKTVQRIIDIVCVRTREKNQNFTCHTDAIPPLIGDESRFMQIIMNLLSNAVKFTPEEGSINFDLLTVSQSEDACVLRITVKDSGVGIEPERLRTLFDVNAQAESGSSGLGLAIAKGLTDLMGGSLTVESEPVKGTSVSFTARFACDTYSGISSSCGIGCKSIPQ